MVLAPPALPSAVVLRLAEVGGEVDTVVVVTDAEDGRGGLSGRMDEDDILPFSLCCLEEKSAHLLCPLSFASFRRVEMQIL